MEEKKQIDLYALYLGATLGLPAGAVIAHARRLEGIDDDKPVPTEALLAVRLGQLAVNGQPEDRLTVEATIAGLNGTGRGFDAKAAAAYLAVADWPSPHSKHDERAAWLARAVQALGAPPDAGPPGVTEHVRQLREIRAMVGGAAGLTVLEAVEDRLRALTLSAEHITAIEYLVAGLGSGGGGIDSTSAPRCIAALQAVLDAKTPSETANAGYLCTCGERSAEPASSALCQVCLDHATIEDMLPALAESGVFPESMPNFIDALQRVLADSKGGA